MKNNQKESFIGQLKGKIRTWKQAMRKTKQLAVGQKESVVSRLQEMCSVDKNQAELEQLPPVQISKDHYYIYQKQQ